MEQESRYSRDLEHLNDSDEKSFSVGRVIHCPEQITSREQLRVGGLYKRLSLNDSGVKQSDMTFKILSLSNILLGKDWIKASHYNSRLDDWVNYDISLADCGIIPYDNGKWNPNNYLIPVKE